MDMDTEGRKMINYVTPAEAIAHKGLRLAMGQTLETSGAAAS